MNTSLNESIIRLNEGKQVKRILVFPFNLLSHYLRCIELVKKINPSIEIIFAGSERYNNWIIEAGYKTFTYNDYDADHVIKCAEKFDFSWINTSEVERMYLQQYSIIKSYKPDLVIGDAANTLRMASEASNVKMIALMNAYMSPYYARTRRLPEIHPAYKYSKKLPENIFDQITNFAEKIAFKLVHKPFKKVRKKYKLCKKNNFLDELQGDLNLICDLHEIFPLNKTPDNFLIIEPLFYKSRAQKSVNINQYISTTKPNILITLGSTGNHEFIELLNDSIFSEFNFIITGLKERVLNKSYVICIPFIDNNHLLPNVDLTICHGGNGTIYQSLSHGVPVVGITNIFEQDYNMQALEELSIGIKCSKNISKIGLYNAIKNGIKLKNSKMTNQIQIKINEAITRT